MQVVETWTWGWLDRRFTFVPLLISLDYLESFAVRSKERGMKMVQFEMNLSVPAVPALAELLNCGPRSRLYNPGAQFKTSLTNMEIKSNYRELRYSTNLIK